MREQFVLFDENGAVLARRRIVHHLKPAAEAQTAGGRKSLYGQGRVVRPGTEGHGGNHPGRLAEI